MVKGKDWDGRDRVMKRGEGKGLRGKTIKGWDEEEG